ncbi:MAG: hypothetical protein EOP50_13735 [Sphingobacteriales bacterium]|nr:MAG: hypothetical protein EOP50_13735 [Sphingobacteriales bacterium]
MQLTLVVPNRMWVSVKFQLFSVQAMGPTVKGRHVIDRQCLFAAYHPFRWRPQLSRPFCPKLIAGFGW